jgi:hypothetical protein
LYLFFSNNSFFRIVKSPPQTFYKNSLTTLTTFNKVVSIFKIIVFRERVKENTRSTSGEEEALLAQLVRAWCLYHPRDIQ